MSQLANLSEIIKDPEFQREFRANIREEARQHNSFVAYIDQQGRMVREYPGTGEIYEVPPGRETLTLLSVHGVPVAPADQVVRPLPYRPEKS